MRHRSTLSIVLVTLALTAACGDKASTSTSSSAAAESATAKSSGPSAAGTSGLTSSAKAAEKRLSTSLTGQQLQDAYDAAIKGKIMDPFDKKKASLTEKLGAPQKTKGETVYWWGMQEKT